MRYIFEYLAAFVAFLAAGFAMMGKPNWNSKQKGLRKLNGAGYIILLFALFALGLQIGLTIVDKQKSDMLTANKNRIAGYAYEELTEILERLQRPFESAVSQNVGYDFTLPDSLMSLNFSKLMLNSFSKVLIGKINLRARFPLPPVTDPTERWGKYFDDVVNIRFEEIDRLLQIYAPYLDHRVFLVVSDLRRDKFLEKLSRLNEMLLTIDESTVKKLGVEPLYLIGDNWLNSPDWREFWILVDRIESILDELTR